MNVDRRVIEVSEKQKSTLDPNKFLQKNIHKFCTGFRVANYQPAKQRIYNSSLKILSKSLFIKSKSS